MSGIQGTAAERIRFEAIPLLGPNQCYYRGRVIDVLGTLTPTVDGYLVGDDARFYLLPRHGAGQVRHRFNHCKWFGMVAYGCYGKALEAAVLRRAERRAVDARAGKRRR